MRQGSSQAWIFHQSINHAGLSLDIVNETATSGAGNNQVDPFGCVDFDSLKRA